MTCWEQIDRLKQQHADLAGWLQAYGKGWSLAETMTAEFRVKKRGSRNRDPVVLSHRDPEQLKQLIADFETAIAKAEARS